MNAKPNRALMLAATLLVAMAGFAQGKETWAPSCSPAAQIAFARGLDAMENGAASDATAQFAEARRLDDACAMAYWGLAAANMADLGKAMSAPRLAYGASLIAEAKACGCTTERECELMDAVSEYYHRFAERTHDERLVYFERALSRSRRVHPEDAVIARWHDRASRAALARATERAESAYAKRVAGQ